MNTPGIKLELLDGKAMIRYGLASLTEDQVRRIGPLERKSQTRKALAAGRAVKIIIVT